jgi:hypothetical protein
VSSRLGPRTVPEGAVLALPGLLAIAVFLVWAANQVGYSPLAWYPGSLLLVIALTICAPVLAQPRRDAASLALLALSLFVLFGYLSIAWAGVRGVAWDGANQALLYLAVFALFSRLRAGLGAATALVSVYAVGVATLGLATLERSLHGSHPALLDWRLAAPTGYPNATAALFLIPLWPALHLAGRRSTPIVLRGVLLATAATLAQLAVLAQSRGALIAAPIVLLAFLALVPGRARAVPTLAIVGGALALNLQRLFGVYRAAEHHTDVPSAIAAARTAILLSAIAVGLCGVLVALIDRRLELSEGTQRLLRGAAAAAICVALVATAAGAFVATGHPVAKARHAWHTFSAGERSSDSNVHLFSLGGTGRYDFWRVAAIDFEHHPIAGVGADNFATDYLRLRKTTEEPTYPHSVELRVLAQLGLIGALLFLVFLGASAVAAFVPRGAGRDERGVAAACAVGFLYWLVHGSVDWFWELPGLAAPAFALLGIALALRAHDGARRLGRAWSRGLLALGAAATLSLLFPLLAAWQVRTAEATWRSNRASALDSLSLARRLNPLSDGPDLVAAEIAQRTGNYEEMRRGFERALQRNAKDWYAHLELGALAAIQHRNAAAIRELHTARALNPREPLIAETLRAARRGHPLPLARLDRAFVERVLDIERLSN